MSNDVFDYSSFPKFILQIWEMEHLSVDSLDFYDIKEIVKKNEIDLLQSDFTTISTAFSMIKILGFVDEELKEDALLSLRRISVYNDVVGFKESRSIEKLQKDLSNFKIYYLLKK